METPPQSQVEQAKHIRIRRFVVALFIGLSLGAVVYLLLHLAGKLDAMGQNGGNIAQIWSFIVAILELAASITAILIAVWQQNKMNKRDKGHTVTSPAIIGAERKFRWWYGVVVLVAAATAFVVPPLVNEYIFRHVSQDNVTQRITLANNTDMTDGDTAHITLPSTEHTKLKIAFHLTSETTTGSCVAPARLKVTPVFNSNEGRILQAVTSDSLQTIELGDMRGTSKLEVRLENDPYCRVKLHIGSATYYN
jgi:hypothetical protein